MKNIKSNMDYVYILINGEDTQTTDWATFKEWVSELVEQNSLVTFSSAIDDDNKTVTVEVF